MYTSSDLKKGLKIEIDGVPYVVTEFNFSKPGKGQAIYNCKLKNMLNGSTLAKTYRSNDKIDVPQLSQKRLKYSYKDGNDYVFMDEDFEQVIMREDVLGDARYFLIEDIAVDVLLYNDKPMEVVLPTFVEKKIIYTEPGARGNTATNVLKPATVEGGYQIQVPLFVNQGDIAKIDTRTGEYVDRVAAKKG